MNDHCGGSDITAKRTRSSLHRISTTFGLPYGAWT